MNNIENKLARIDLNLLVSLSVLLQEQNVSKAAQRLFLSQSAMSRTLQRLRDLFDDPLFHRTAKGITPTVKALALAKQLPELLDHLNNVIDETTFEPQTSDQRFTLSVPSLMSHALLVPLMKEIARTAPKLCLSAHAAKVEPLAGLAKGNLDFAIHTDKPADKNYNVTEITSCVATVYANKNHPLVQQKLVKEADCFNYNFADLIIENDSAPYFKHPINTLLEGKGLVRNITARSSQLSVLVELLKSENLLLIAADFLETERSNMPDLVPVYRFNTKTDPKFSLYLISHKRIDNSAAHQWLQAQWLSIFA